MLRLPARAKANVQYGIAVVTASPNRARAQAFVSKLLMPRAQKTLLAAGFLPRVEK